jgi:tRNA-Thr(GGU) m(6)t(6)A37 methyltransferase TsaA
MTSGTIFQLTPIGKIRKQAGQVWIDIDPAFKDAMTGLASFSHIHVLYWFHENDTAEARSILQVRPRKNPRNPLTGVFATHSPRRPNLIAMSICRISRIEDHLIHIDGIDAHDNSPVIDIKCYIPSDIDANEVRLPAWVKEDSV